MMQSTKLATRRIYVLREFLVTVASILGVSLIVLGIGLLAYYDSPERLMLGAVLPHRPNPMPPILGGVALVGDIALL
jgi:hypothetical protein